MSEKLSEHKWKMVGGPGEYDTLYECTKCHKQRMESMDNPASWRDKQTHDCPMGGEKLSERVRSCKYTMPPLTYVNGPEIARDACVWSVPRYALEQWGNEIADLEARLAEAEKQLEVASKLADITHGAAEIRERHGLEANTPARSEQKPVTTYSEFVALLVSRGYIYGVAETKNSYYWFSQGQKSAPVDTQAKLAQVEARVVELEQENHNLNWALGTEGFEKMATPEDRRKDEL